MFITALCSAMFVGLKIIKLNRFILDVCELKIKLVFCVLFYSTSFQFYKSLSGNIHFNA